MSINRENYELYFIDYLDGNLNEQDTAELMVFLAGNPDLEEELDMVQTVNLEVEDAQFAEKDSLKKFDFSDLKVNEQNFDEYAVADLENDLSASESAAFNAYLKKHPELNKSVDLFKATVSVPDESIVFPNKTVLKRKHGRVISIRRALPYISVAASVAIAFFVFRAFSPEGGSARGMQSGDLTAVNHSRSVYADSNSDTAVSTEQELLVSFPDNSHTDVINHTEPRVEVPQKLKGNHYAEIPVTYSVEKVNLLTKKDDILIAALPVPVKNENNSNSNNQTSTINEDYYADNFQVEEKRFKVWKTIEGGVNTVSQLAFNKKVFNNSYHEDGSIKTLDINTKLFAVKTNFK